MAQVHFGFEYLVRPVWSVHHQMECRKVNVTRRLRPGFQLIFTFHIRMQH